MKIKVIFSIAVVIMLSMGIFGSIIMADGNTKNAETAVKAADKNLSALYKEMKENLQFVKENGALAKLNETKLNRAETMYKKAVTAAEKCPSKTEARMKRKLQKRLGPILDEMKDYQMAVKTAKNIDSQFYIFQKEYQDLPRTQRNDQITIFKTKLSFESTKFSHIQNKTVREVFNKLYDNKLEQLESFLVADAKS